ncbi:MAG: hypothetical protein ACFFF9_17290 [Candidatus Thorarchaeota archaeon]
MKNRTILIIWITLMFIIPVTDARAQDSVPKLSAIAIHGTVIDAYSWESVPVQCYAGDNLSGDFLITHNGELFPGDLTEYDNWLRGGIDFFIFDEENYSSWVEGLSATPLVEHLDLQELTWSIEIPYNGVWYVVYSNDTIYIIEIEENIVRSGMYDQFILLFVFVGIAVLLFLTLILWKKK